MTYSVDACTGKLSKLGSFGLRGFVWLDNRVLGLWVILTIVQVLGKYILIKLELVALPVLFAFELAFSAMSETPLAPRTLKRHPHIPQAYNKCYRQWLAESIGQQLR